MGEQYLSFRGVRELTSLSESTVRRLIAVGRFPRPQSITPGRRVFAESDVRRAVNRLLAEQKRTQAAAPGDTTPEAPAV